MVKVLKMTILFCIFGVLSVLRGNNYALSSRNIIGLCGFHGECPAVGEQDQNIDRHF